MKNVQNIINYKHHCSCLCSTTIDAIYEIDVYTVHFLYTAASHATYRITRFISTFAIISISTSFFRTFNSFRCTLFTFSTFSLPCLISLTTSERGCKSQICFYFCGRSNVWNREKGDFSDNWNNNLKIRVNKDYDFTTWSLGIRWLVILLLFIIRQRWLFTC